MNILVFLVPVQLKLISHHINMIGMLSGGKLNMRIGCRFRLIWSFWDEELCKIGEKIQPFNVLKKLYSLWIK